MMHFFMNANLQQLDDTVEVERLRKQQFWCSYANINSEFALSNH